MSQTDYSKYRGKCKELAEAYAENNPDFEVVRGYYFCLIWNTEEQHWFCKHKVNDSIYDPSRKQFPSKGHGEYTLFDGMVKCSQCGKIVKEKEANFASNYSFCSYNCYGKFVGVA